MSGNIRIKFTTKPHDCGMCGPSGMTEAVLTIDHPAVTRTFRQSFCDNSDPLDTEAMLYAALEELGYEVRVDRKDEW